MYLFVCLFVSAYILFCKYECVLGTHLGGHRCVGVGGIVSDGVGEPRRGLYSSLARCGSRWESRRALDAAATGHKTYRGSHVEGAGGGGAAAGGSKQLAQQ